MFRRLRGSSCWLRVAMATFLLCLAAPASAHVLETIEGAGPQFGQTHPPLAALSDLPNITLSALPPRAPQPPTLIEHGARDQKRLALTFDACSTLAPSGYDDRIIEVLRRTQTPATLFLGGAWMLQEHQHLRELSAMPFLELGMHGYTHPHLPTVSEERISQELMLDEQVLFALTGRRADLFRPPYGEYDDRVLRIAGSLGFLTINFDAASGDPDPHATRDKLLDWVPRIVKPGSIVVMHVNGRGWHTAEALEELIATLRRQGYELVTVSELLGRRDTAAGMVTPGQTQTATATIDVPAAATPAVAVATKPATPTLTTAPATVPAAILAAPGGLWPLDATSAGPTCISAAPAWIEALPDPTAPAAAEASNR